MNETVQHLRNMSSYSRSTVSVQPRHVEPPPTTARGARVRGDAGVSVALSRTLIRGDCVPLWILADAILPKERRSKNLTELERTLQSFADAVIARARLIGCVIMYDQKQLQASRANQQTIAPIADDGLAFAILAKTSDRLFIATKTPNLAPHLLQRTLVTFDPRIVTLAGGRP
jgi:hypothetical protein